MDALEAEMRKFIIGEFPGLDCQDMCDAIDLFRSNRTPQERGNVMEIWEELRAHFRHQR